jgi:hypothetical protein
MPQGSGNLGCFACVFGRAVRLTGEALTDGEALNGMSDRVKVSVQTGFVRKCIVDNAGAPAGTAEPRRSQSTRLETQAGAGCKPLPRSKSPGARARAREPSDSPPLERADPPRAAQDVEPDVERMDSPDTAADLKADDEQLYLTLQKIQTFKQDLRRRRSKDTPPGVEALSSRPPAAVRRSRERTDPFARASHAQQSRRKDSSPFRNRGKGKVPSSRSSVLLQSWTDEMLGRQRRAYAANSEQPPHQHENRSPQQPDSPLRLRAEDRAGERKAPSVEGSADLNGFDGLMQRNDDGTGSADQRRAQAPNKPAMRRVSVDGVCPALVCVVLLQVCGWCVAVL